MVRYYTDYESWGNFQTPQTSELLEAYSGTSVVSWYGNIERQIVSMIDQYESAKNDEYADKLRVYLQTWRDNPISGSINVETLQVLEAATAQNAVDPWKLANYFSNLRDSIRKLIAAQEELPTGDAGDQPGSRAKSSPRPPSDFGANATPPAGGAGGGGEAAPPPEGAPG